MFTFQRLVCSVVLVLGSGMLSPVGAAERLTIRVGFLEQSIDVEDLEQFAETGRVSGALRTYAPLLTLEVRQALSRRLQFDERATSQVIDRFLQASESQPFLKALTDVIPGSDVKQLQTALALAARKANGLNAISFLKAYPQPTIEVDATAAVGLLTQLNLGYWKTQILASTVERELATKTPFQRLDRDPTVAGREVVQRQALTVYDAERQRTIPVEVYWSGRSHGPLVVLSHGLGADRYFMSYLAEHLASHGLSVAALDHPRSNGAWLRRESNLAGFSQLLPANEFVDRPRDIRFLLDEFTKLNTQPGRLQGKLQTQQVTVIGHSLGGTTALMLAGAELDLNGLKRVCRNRNPLGKAPADWLQCVAAQLDTLPSRRLRDQRVVQVIALNPVIGELFGDRGLSKVETPTMLLASTDDALTPALSQQFQPFAQLPNPKYLITAIGATHLSVSNPGVKSIAQTNIAPERQGEDVEPLRKLVRGVSLAFVQQLTPNAHVYAPFLTPAYAQSLSTPTLPLRFSTTLPSSLSHLN
jgi:predicted dienelactone hydrolase